MSSMPTVAGQIRAIRSFDDSGVEGRSLSFEVGVLTHAGQAAMLREFSHSIP